MNLTQKADIEKLLSIARSHAKKRGYESIADDFAQEVYIEYAGGRKTTIKNLFIDFLREQYGSTRHPSGRARIAAVRTQVSLDAPAGDGIDALKHEFIGGAPDDSGPKRDPRRYDVDFRGREYLIYKLCVLDELSQDEVGEGFGLDPSRISQLLSNVKKEIVAKALIDECYDFYKDDPEYSKLSIDWITL